MTARHSVLALVVLSALTACEKPAATPTGAVQADTAAVAALLQQEVTAVTTGDTVLAYMADDIVLMPPNEPAMVGVPAARAWFAGFARQFRASISYGNKTVLFSGDHAVEQYAATLTLTPVAGGEPMTETLKGLHVYRRDASGAWKMVRDIWNSDAPPPQVR